MGYGNWTITFWFHVLTMLLRSHRHVSTVRLFSSIVAKNSVVLEKEGRIGILRLNDPVHLNALTAEMGDRVEGNTTNV
jgi:hypothetical protein